MNVCVIDLGIGNISSLTSALTYLGANNVVVTSDPSALVSATHIILPGVGAFDTAIRAADDMALRNPIQRVALQNRIPLLGICLGMQILFEGSDEGCMNGLGLMPGHFTRLRSDTASQRKVPHVGFSLIHGYRESGLFRELGAQAHLYFTHSYALPALADNCNVATCQHTRPFVAAFQKENICGVQFHPEKSQSTGLRLLSNFLEMK